MKDKNKIRQYTIFSKEKELFKMAQQSKFLPNIFVAMLIFAILWIGSMALAQFIYDISLSYILSNSIIKEATNQTIHRIVICGIQICTFFAWVKFVEKRSVKTMGFTSNKAFSKYLTGFILGILTIAAITLVLVMIGAVCLEVPKDASKQGMNALSGILIMLLGWSIQSASEEIGIRGWLLPIIGTKYNVPLGIFVTSTVFGVAHLFNPHVTILSFVNLVLSGVFFALFVIWEGSLWGVYGYHCAWNWALVNIFGFAVSGFSPAGGSLFKFKITGSDIITGGFFGPEGGILLTLFLSIGIILLIQFIRKKSAIN